MTNEIEWKGSPSQLLNFGVFLSGIFIVTLPLIILRWKNLKDTIYEISNTRVCSKSNFVEKRTECIDIEDIKQISIEHPLFLKIFSLSNIIISSSDNKKIVFAGVKDSESIISRLKKINKSIEI